MTRAATTRAPAEAGERAKPRPAKATTAKPEGYFQRAEMPLTSLVFLLPLIILYELGTQYISQTTHQGEQRIIAFNLLQDFFNFCHASGRYLPAMAVVGILLSWHIARNDPWDVRFWTIAGMIVECFVLAIPLILLGFVAARYWSLSAVRMPPASLIILSIGAGIYEELVFRLIALTVLHVILIDILKVRKGLGYMMMVLISSVLFAGYHYLGAEHFVWQTFVFRTGAGLYFGAIFVFRGFGVTAGSHSAYDVLIVLLRVLLSPHA